jgi:hypothetical protein
MAMAKWTAKYINNLADSAFLYIEPGGKKDEEGKTTPRRLRHFPYKDENGKIDLPHLRNAIARAPQAKLPEAVIARVQAKARRILKAESPQQGMSFAAGNELCRGWHSAAGRQHAIPERPCAARPLRAPH